MSIFDEIQARKSFYEKHGHPNFYPFNSSSDYRIQSLLVYLLREEARSQELIEGLRREYESKPLRNLADPKVKKEFYISQTKAIRPKIEALDNLVMNAKKQMVLSRPVK